MNPFDIAPLLPNEEPTFPEVPIYYATKKGWMVNTPTLFGVALTEAKKPPQHLGETKTAFRMNDRHVPAFIIKQAHDFFLKVWNQYKSEAMVFIIHDNLNDRYRLWVPEQYVSHVSVNYQLPAGAIPRRWQAIGTIHSHCDFGAFHSGTDQHDMAGIPGLHITIGHVQREEPDLAIALSVNKSQFDVVDSDHIIDKNLDTDRHGRNTAPDFWMSFVKTGTAPWQGKSIYYRPATPKTSFLPARARPNDWYGNRGFERPKPFTHTSQTQLFDDFDTDEWYSKTINDLDFQTKNDWDPFEIHKEEIEMSEMLLNNEAMELADLGFILNFNIMWNPKKAQDRLEKLLTTEDNETND